MTLRLRFDRTIRFDRGRLRGYGPRVPPWPARLLLCLLLAACARKDAPAWRVEAVTRGPVTEVVSATGDVAAIITVNIGSQVSGTVDRLLVDFNSKVKKGQLLATIDPRLFQAALEKARAGLAAAAANVEKAEVTLADADRQLRREHELRAGNLVSQAELDTAQANRDGAAAQLSSARASVLQARADRDLANANLAYTRIASPIDGIVVSRSIDVGQTVAAAFQAPTLFTIANDLTKMQILANIDEADVGKVREGLESRFTVDAFPGEVFIGRIREVRQAPTTIQNVVTYAAVIDAPNPERKLRQGMTASVTITIAQRDEVVRIPNGALRFRPDDATPPSDAPLASAPRGRAPERRAAPASAEGGRPGRVFRLEGGRPVAVAVRLGITDGARTEVVDGLASGDSVIVGAASDAAAPQKARRGPF